MSAVKYQQKPRTTAIEQIWMMQYTVGNEMEFIEWVKEQNSVAKLFIPTRTLFDIKPVMMVAKSVYSFEFDFDNDEIEEYLVIPANHWVYIVNIGEERIDIYCFVYSPEEVARQFDLVDLSKE